LIRTSTHHPKDDTAMKLPSFRHRRPARRSFSPLGLRPLVEAFERRELLASTNFLQGVVLDASNNPLAGATVAIYSEPSNTPVGSIVTGSSGAYAFSGLAAGQYQLVETPPTNYTNVSTSDLTGLYKTTLGTSTINVTISDGTSPALPWQITPIATNPVGMYVNVGPNSYPGYVGQFTDVQVNEQDVPYPTNIVTFCADLNRDLIAPPNTPADSLVPYDVMPLAQALAATAGTSATNAGEIAYLYNHYGLNPNLSPTDSAGLQLAIWDLEYGSVSAGPIVIPVAGVTQAGIAASQANFESLAAGHSEAAYYLLRVRKVMHAEPRVS
jgi:hypothetical protein